MGDTVPPSSDGASLYQEPDALFQNPSIHIPLSMGWLSEWRQFLQCDRLDKDMDRTPALVCSNMSCERRSELDQSGLCQLIWAPDDELYFSTGKGVLGGQIVIEGNLGVMMICGGHSVIFRTYRVITSAEPFGKGFLRGVHMPLPLQRSVKTG